MCLYPESEWEGVLGSAIRDYNRRNKEMRLLKREFQVEKPYEVISAEELKSPFTSDLKTPNGRGTGALRIGRSNPTCTSKWQNDLNWFHLGGLCRSTFECPSLGQISPRGRGCRRFMHTDRYAA